MAHRRRAQAGRRCCRGYRPDTPPTYAAGVTAQPLTRTPLTAKLAGFGTTIFAEMSALAVHDRIDQPRPGLPRHRRPGRGARRRRRRDPHRRQPVPARARACPCCARRSPTTSSGSTASSSTPIGEVLVTAGATEALAGALLGHARHRRRGRRVRADVRQLPGVHRPRRRGRPDRWCCAPASVPTGSTGSTPTSCAPRSRPRTKLVLVNTPHNPTGKVFTVDELTTDRRDRRTSTTSIVVTDEVYEHLVFSGARHVPMATLPGMAERTLTISSGGKTFNTTGWKVGWVCGPAALVDAAKTAKQFLTYVNAAPFQPAIAVGLGLARRVLRRARRRPRGQARPAVRRTRRRRVRGLPAGGDLLHHGRHPPDRARRRRLRVLPRDAARGSAWWRSRTRCSTPTRNTAGTSCGSPAASGSR